MQTQWMEGVVVPAVCSIPHPGSVPESSHTVVIENLIDLFIQHHQATPDYTRVHLNTPQYTWIHLTSPDHMGCEVEQPSPAGLSKFIKRSWSKAEVQEYSSLNFWQIMEGKNIHPYLFSCRFLRRHRSTCLSDHPVFLIGACQRSSPTLSVCVCFLVCGICLFVH